VAIAPPCAGASRSSAVRGLGSPEGRGYVVPEDIERLFLPVLGHRLLLTTSFLAETRVLARDEALELI